MLRQAYVRPNPSNVRATAFSGFVEMNSNDAVARRAAKTRVGLPRQREQEGRVARARRVDDDVVAEAAAVLVLRLLAARCLRREDLLEVPDAVLVLHEVHERMLDLRSANEEALIDDVARIERQRDAAGAEKQLAALVPDRDRVDRDLGERDLRSAFRCRSVPPLSFRATIRLHARPKLLASRFRARQEEDRGNTHDPQQDEHDHGDERHEPATSHARTMRRSKR